MENYRAAGKSDAEVQPPNDFAIIVFTYFEEKKQFRYRPMFKSSSVIEFTR